MSLDPLRAPDLSIPSWMPGDTAGDAPVPGAPPSDGSASATLSGPTDPPTLPTADPAAPADPASPAAPSRDQPTSPADLRTRFDALASNDATRARLRQALSDRQLTDGLACDPRFQDAVAGLLADNRGFTRRVAQTQPQGAQAMGPTAPTGAAVAPQSTPQVGGGRGRASGPSGGGGGGGGGFGGGGGGVGGGGYGGRNGYGRGNGLNGFFRSLGAFLSGLIGRGGSGSGSAQSRTDPMRALRQALQTGDVSRILQALRPILAQIQQLQRQSPSQARSMMDQVQQVLGKNAPQLLARAGGGQQSSAMDPSLASSPDPQELDAQQ